MGDAKVKTLMLGGKVILKNGKPTGVLIDNAIKLVSDKIPDAGTKESRSVLIAAQANCFSVGLTTVADAGLVWIKKNRNNVSDAQRQLPIIKNLRSRQPIEGE